MRCPVLQLARGKRRACLAHELEGSALLREKEAVRIGQVGQQGGELLEGSGRWVADEGAQGRKARVLAGKLVERISAKQQPVCTQARIDAGGLRVVDAQYRVIEHVGKMAPVPGRHARAHSVSCVHMRVAARACMRAICACARGAHADARAFDALVEADIGAAKGRVGELALSHDRARHAALDKRGHKLLVEGQRIGRRNEYARARRVHLHSIRPRHIQVCPERFHQTFLRALFQLAV